MIKIVYDEKTIQRKRKTVADALFNESKNIKSRKIKCISVQDLNILFKHYDRIFLNNWFARNFKGQITFDLSSRMTKSAGITKCPKNVTQIKPEQVGIIICIGIDFFFKFDSIGGCKNVCGLKTRNSLEALQIVFEHELIHALEFIMFHTSNCSKERFRDTAKNLFGHIGSHHQLPTNLEIAGEKLDINIGDKVQFLYNEKRLTGLIANINKRATVMVENPDGIYTDKKGIKYVKYYVPLNKLIKI